MNHYRLWTGLCLTAIAGAIDAVSFVRFGAVYASFMSGNTIQVGLHAAAADWSALGYFLALIALFMAGGFAGSLLVAIGGRWHLPAIVAIETASLGLALWIDQRHGMPLASTAPLSFAMGAQNNLVVLVRGANPATTFVTGTAFRFAEALAQKMLGRDPWGAWKLHLVVWLAFGIGAALGTVGQVKLDALAIAPLAAAALVLLLVTLGVEVARGNRPAPA